MLLDFETHQYNNEVEKAIQKVQTNSKFAVCSTILSFSAETKEE